MKAKNYITLLFIVAFNQLFAQTKCDSISFSPDTIYLNESTDHLVFDTMHWTGETELGFASVSYQFDDTTRIDIDDSYATNGAWGPYTFVSPFGYSVIYNMAGIPENTIVNAFRTVNHHSLQATCMKAVTFIINPSSSLGVKNPKDQTDFKLYPNPAVDNVTIEWEQSEDKVLITVTDLLGKVRASLSNFSGQKITIDTRPFSEGMYLVSVSNSKGSLKTQQIVIAK
ncbi:T9SS type A sorting domain-containing protein [Fluviicola taffensis]|uniref:Secretion system C-terminal sorting domain-containing protein n=1 Tax=Fluviicola taffensis (strain DSM 16823 / NCIMB 13979 / RW262) TaxID=755732 RepID=F2IFD2_FLUTR|nr:T9SS type A sorting domain-containing protein [Fluviicola taffensis]AEA44617.1 hypothetical protein Fluta_2635 [Fluviicola taffensis DSM 16823]